MRKAVIAVALAAAACSGTSSEVAMTNDFAFDPETVAIEAGSTLTFVNDSDQPHTVTAHEEGVPPGEYFSSGGFSSEADAREGIGNALVTPGETFALTPSARGTYRYFCIPHEGQGMKGSFVVE